MNKKKKVIVPFYKMVRFCNEDGMWWVDSEKYTKEEIIDAFEEWYGVRIKKSDIYVRWVNEIGVGKFISVHKKPSDTTYFKRCWFGDNA